MTQKITFVSPSVKEFVAKTAMLDGDKEHPQIDTPEERSILQDFLSNNKDLPKNERDYVRGYINEYDKNVAKAVISEAMNFVISESKALTAKDVKREMLEYAQTILDEKEGIKISKGKIRRYMDSQTIKKDKMNISKMFGYEKKSSAEAKNNAKEEKINTIKAVISDAMNFVASESKATTAKDVRREMLEYAQAILEQEKGIKVSKRELEKYADDRKNLLARSIAFINNQ